MVGKSEAAEGEVSRNLNGQKLGRKGKDTRARILAAAAELISDEGGDPITLSAVARRVSLGMTSLYLYFSDLTELIIAVLEPVTATAEQDFIWRLRERWPDDDLAQHCQAFVADFYGHWRKHSRLLHLRNSMADAHDQRMMAQRVQLGQVIIRLVVHQMDGETEALQSPRYSMASMLITGIERASTVWTDSALRHLIDSPDFGDSARFLTPAARLLELGIRDMRAMPKD